MSSKCLDSWIAGSYGNNKSEQKIEIKSTPNKVDDFADGRSAERITAYISNLIEGLKTGVSPDKAIHNADMHYSKAWGKDKVIDAKMRL